MYDILTSEQINAKTVSALQGEYRLNFSEIIREAVQTFHAHMTNFIGLMLVFGLLVGFLIFIPFLNIFVLFTAPGFLICGFLWMCYQSDNQNDIEFKTFFEVRKRLADISLLSLLHFLVYLVPAIPFFIIYGSLFVGSFFSASGYEQEKLQEFLTSPGYYISLLSIQSLQYVLFIFLSLSFGLMLFGGLKAGAACRLSFQIVKANMKEHFKVQSTLIGIIIALSVVIMLLVALGSVASMILVITGIFGLYAFMLFYMFPLFIVFQYRIMSKVLQLDHAQIDEIDSIGTHSEF